MLTFTAPLLQHRGATPAQQERALMRRCLTMVSKIQNSKKKLCLPLAFLSALLL